MTCRTFNFGLFLLPLGRPSLRLTIASATLGLFPLCLPGFRFAKPSKSAVNSNLFATILTIVQISCCILLLNYNKHAIT